MGKINTKINYLLLLIIMSFLAGGCQSLPFSQPPEHALQKRVSGMMAARVAENWAEVYEYIDPGYKNRVSKKDFTGMTRDIQFGDFTVETLEIGPSGKDAVVTVKYDMTVMSYTVADHRETQNWVKTDGKWYHQIKTDSKTGRD